ncbi:hypothetical protein B0H66DRAFT_578709 [Apodospora peruviana]|uniref:Protein kinase domain-containing protein n=1 Tax=Apodospora peruviana TaxID=516989 RepID=A0AAE0HS45_9PEZI|nr:hypothetical protein B0H66DRAFT_578709 [Apodospora peruviana]
MARLLSTDAVLLGQLHKPANEGAVYLARNLSVKSIRGHWRLRNEADILKRYQSETRFLRPLVDDIHDPADPPSIVLCYLDSDMLTESNKKRLSRPETKQAGSPMSKLDNIFINHGQGDDQRFSDIQLGDCGGVVSQDSSFAKEGHFIGAAFTRSPEATFQLPWGTATDIWSFGAAMLSLVFGGGYHLFNPKIEKVEPGSDGYEFIVLKRMHRFLGPYPQSYKDFKDENTITIINSINAQGPLAMPFHRVGRREVPKLPWNFLLKIMKLDSPPPPPPPR